MTNNNNYEGRKKINVSGIIAYHLNTAVLVDHADGWVGIIFFFFWGIVLETEGGPDKGWGDTTDWTVCGWGRRSMMIDSSGLSWAPYNSINSSIAFSSIYERVSEI